MSISTSSKRFSDPSLGPTNGHNGNNGHQFPLRPITNYPEHLNPFYKDENHKRIRFLKVLPKKLNLTSPSPSSKAGSSGGGARRSSFSFEGMRDMWKLRPFRSSNKKPMPLTVTKTSESPPQLRRDLTIQDVPFERNNRVRASMQETRGSPGSGIYGYQNENNNFLRNSRYRNTMAGGTGAPTIASPLTMRQRYSQQSGGGMKPGSSELSIRSTNPFDEDDNYDDGMSVSGMSVASMPNRPYRKKRRAPLPPINSNKTDDDKSEASINPRVIVTSPSTESGTTEQFEMTDRTTVTIQNIASELDAMIRRTDSVDSVDKEKTKGVDQERDDRQLKDDPPEDEILTIHIIDRQGGDPTESISNRSDPKPLPKPRELIAKEVVEEDSASAKIVTITSSTTTVHKVGKKENRSGSSGALRIIESDDESEIPVTIRSFDDSTKDTTPKPLENGNARDEASGSTATVYENSAPLNGNGTAVGTEQYDVRFVPLVDKEEPVVETVTEDGSSSAGKPKTVNVKDIIESINKSQSLLKINYEDHKARRTSNGSINTRIRELERKETEINEMLNEIDLDRKVNGLCSSRTDDQIVEEEINEIPVVIRDLESQISREEDSGSLFQKCRPTSLSQQNRPLSGDHDWNPLPKPKRSSPTTSPTK